MLCCASSCLSRSPALVTVLVAIVVVSCIAAVGAQPAARRSEASANSADNGHNGLRRSQNPKRQNDPPRYLCGKELRDELASICKGRGYNSPHAGMTGGLRTEGAATYCCERGCTRKFLDSYCIPLPTNASEASESIEQVKESVSDEVEITETSNNQLRPKPQPEEPKSDDAVEPAETENAIFRAPPKQHNFYVKRNNYHQVNSPVTTRRQIIR